MNGMVDDLMEMGVTNNKLVEDADYGRVEMAENSEVGSHNGLQSMIF